MKILALLFFIIFSNLLFSQITVDKKTVKYYDEKTKLIDDEKVKYNDSTNLVINDSINAKVFKSENLIMVKNSTINNKINFQIKFYFENKNLFFAKFIEKSPKFDKTNKILEFYVANDNIVFLKSHYKVGINLPPMLMEQKEVEKNFGYNSNLTKDYIYKYINNLYELIRKQ